jgi:hypothetical protein
LNSFYNKSHSLEDIINYVENFYKVIKTGGLLDQINFFTRETRVEKNEIALIIYNKLKFLRSEKLIDFREGKYIKTS